jgi:hypothetical protein
MPNVQEGAGTKRTGRGTGVSTAEKSHDLDWERAMEKMPTIWVLLERKKGAKRWTVVLRTASMAPQIRGGSEKRGCILEQLKRRLRIQSGALRRT